MVGLLASACVAAPTMLIGDALPAIDAPSPDFAVRVLDYQGAPLASAELDIVSGLETWSVVSDTQGMIVVQWNPLGMSFHAEAPAHQAADVTLDVRPTDTLEVRMTATVLQGFVAGVGGRLLEGATVTADGQTTTSGPDGSFRLVAVEPGTVSASRAAYVDGTAEWTEPKGIH